VTIVTAPFASVLVTISSEVVKWGCAAASEVDVDDVWVDDELAELVVAIEGKLEIDIEDEE